MIHIKYIYTVISWAPDQAACLPEAHTGTVVPLPPQIGLELGAHSPRALLLCREAGAALPGSYRHNSIPRLTHKGKARKCISSGG